MIDLLIKQPYFVALSKKEQQGQVTILKEYAYVDGTTGQQGIIDLLIIENGKATILDYKTTNLEDPAYPKQLATYQRYVESRGIDVVSMYLIALTTSQIKKVYGN
jgi:ATP-dependent exoDNAse (exonuclease V) beta subunit